jgi:hypothetical protein
MELRDLENRAYFLINTDVNSWKFRLYISKIQLNMHTLLYKHKREYLGFALVQTSWK